MAKDDDRKWTGRKASTVKIGETHAEKKRRKKGLPPIKDVKT